MTDFLPYRYSQAGEDNFIVDYFDKYPPRRKIYCDIGAFDGDLFSNTRALHNRGWTGALVEPHPLPFWRLEKLYGGQSGIIVIQAAVGDVHKRGSSIELYHPPVLDYGQLMLSTCLEEEKLRWKYTVTEWLRVVVPVMSLRQILDVLGSVPDFLTIDVEGMDLEVFESAEFKVGDDSPMLVMFEHNDNRHGVLDQSDKLLSKFGYKRVFTNPINAAWHFRA